MPPKKAKKKAKAIDYAAEAKAAYYFYLNCCKTRKVHPNERISSSFGKVMSEAGAETSKKKPKGAEVLCLVDDAKPRSLRALADVLIEYPRCKNLCFWGTATAVTSPGATESNDAILDAVASVLDHKKVYRWSRASALLHLKILGNGSRQLTHANDDLNDASTSESDTDEDTVTMDLSATTEPRIRTRADAQCCFSMEHIAALNTTLLHTTTLLQVIILSNTTLGDVGFKAFFDGLYGLRTLKHLGLSFTGLTSASGPLLAKLIAGHAPAHLPDTAAVSKENTNLSNLPSMVSQPAPSPSSTSRQGIARNDSIHAPFFAGITSVIATSSYQGHSHQTLAAAAAVSAAAAADEQAQAQAQAHVQQLQKLSLEGNYLGEKGLMHVGIGLQSPFTSVQILNLSANDIIITSESRHRECLDNFVRGLAASRTVSQIDLRRNFIGNDAMEVLIPALAANTNIKLFRVSAMKLQRDIVRDFCLVMGGRNVKAKKKKGKKKAKKKA